MIYKIGFVTFCYLKLANIHRNCDKQGFIKNILSADKEKSIATLSCNAFSYDNRVVLELIIE